MNKKMLAAIVVALSLGLLALAAVSVHSLRRSDAPVKKAATLPPATLLANHAARPGDEAVLKAAVARAPGDATALTKLGDHYAAQRAFPTAIDTYRKAVAVDPQAASAWSGLGEAYVQIIPSTRAALPPQAREAFLHAVAINGNDLRARFYLAMEKDFLGHHDEAIDDWIRMLGMVSAGSQADGAIRAAIVASMGRSATILRHRVEAATAAQKAVTATP